MSKISDQSAYPLVTPVVGDYLIGTDTTSANATKNFTVGSIIGLTPANTLQEVLTAGNTAIEDINLTGDIALTGNFSGTGNITRTGHLVLTGNISGTGDINRTGAITATGTITSDTNIVAGTTVSARSYIGTLIPAYANDTAAGVGGLVAGDFFQTDGTAGAPLNEPGIIMIKQ
tara:strand:- start:1143 stop:1664 length:522 start_codon:yes stop_codon:yes gene_type:complete